MGNTTANAKEEIFVLHLTEWELDTLYKSLQACQYPGTHVDLVVSLMNKIKGIAVEKEKGK